EGRLEDLLTQTEEWQVRTKGLGERQRQELHAWLTQRGAEVIQEGSARERLEDYFLRSLPESERR
ncbi:MAG: hypothetical protein RLZZ112_1062, partial [Verrucomicrobiota bacterium]